MEVSVKTVAVLSQCYMNKKRLNRENSALLYIVDI